jgi:two-component system alkaline phosphatase synthesis response regulator PhoP
MDSKSPKILIVEDSGFYRRGLELGLKRAGFTVTSAATGEEGLQAAQEHPDLIVLDMMLPKLNGMMVLRVLRGAPATREIPVIVLSGTAMERDIEQAEKLGISRFLKKEISPTEQIVAAVRSTLRNSA